VGDAISTQVAVEAAARIPRTERGRRTHRALLDAAAQEFGANGFHATGITEITRRAGVALGSFYTYFASKEEVFRAVVADMTEMLRAHITPHVLAAPDAVSAEHVALQHFLLFVREQQMLYRIIDEAEFVAPDSHRSHYELTVGRIAARLTAGAARGELRADVGEIEAWAIAGMNVFLGLRYGVWDDGSVHTADVAQRANRLLADGIRRKD